MLDALVTSVLSIKSVHCSSGAPRQCPFPFDSSLFQVDSNPVQRRNKS